MPQCQTEGCEQQAWRNGLCYYEWKRSLGLFDGEPRPAKPTTIDELFYWSEGFDDVREWSATPRRRPDHLGVVQAARRGARRGIR